MHEQPLVFSFRKQRINLYIHQWVSFNQTFPCLICSGYGGCMPLASPNTYMYSDHAQPHRVCPYPTHQKIHVAMYRSCHELTIFHVFLVLSEILNLPKLYRYSVNEFTIFHVLRVNILNCTGQVMNWPLVFMFSVFYIHVSSKSNSNCTGNVNELTYYTIYIRLQIVQVMSWIDHWFPMSTSAIKK